MATEHVSSKLLGKMLMLRGHTRKAFSQRCVVKRVPTTWEPQLVQLARILPTALAVYKKRKRVHGSANVHRVCA